MTTENTSTAGVVTPAAPDTSVQTARKDVVVNPPPEGESVIIARDKFNERIAQAKSSAETEARAALLKELGVANVDEAKAIAKAAKDAAEANKSAEQRAVEARSALESKTAEATKLSEMAARIATAAMSSLTDEQQAVIKTVAGDDPAKQIETIEALKPTWAKPADAKVAKAAVVPGATTSGAGAAPPPANPNAPNHKATLESLEKSNPMAAAHYALRHQGEIYTGDGS